MTTYTLFSQSLTDTDAGNTTALSAGTQFSLSQACTLGKFWWYSPSTADALPDAVAIYTVTGQAQVSGTLINSPAWSGAAGSGWVSTTYSSPPALASGTNYLMVVHGKGTSTGWYGRIVGYFSSGAGSGGVSNGPISAPGNAAAANGQGCSLNGSSIAYPTSAGAGNNFLIDIEVTPAATQATAALTGIGTLTASGVLAAAAALTGQGSLGVSPVLGYPGALAMSGQGTLGVQAVLGYPGALAMSGQGTLAAAPVLGYPGAAVMSGLGSLSATPVLGYPGALAMSGQGTLALAPVLGYPSAAALAGLGSLGVSAVLGYPGALAMSGLGTLGLAPVLSYPGAAAMSGLGYLFLTRLSASFGSVLAADRGAASVSVLDRAGASVSAVDLPAGT